MKKTILFEIITQKKIPLDIPLDILRKYPMHSDQLYIGEKILLIYDYEPTKITNETKYIEYLTSKFKIKYNAYSITVGELQKQIK